MNALRMLFKTSDEFRAKFRGSNVRIQGRNFKDKSLPRDQQRRFVYDVWVDEKLKLESANSMEALNYFDDEP